jgi:hypothetical protein
MNGRTLGLDEIAVAYRRIGRSLYRALEDAYDFVGEDIVAEEIIRALERDQTVLDAAFFILIFGQLEQRVASLATAGEGRGSGRRGFTSLLAAALPRRDERDRRREIERWYALRNRAAHGEEIAASYNTGDILARVRELQERIGQ